MLDAGSVKVTTIEIKSAGSMFGAAVPGMFVPPFDVASATKLFKLTTAGVSSLDFGKILPAGLSGDALSGRTCRSTARFCRAVAWAMLQVAVLTCTSCPNRPTC